ncbi:MAG: hypothetical protein ACPGXZ_06605 [Saprospiraceae bacterium]
MEKPTNKPANRLLLKDGKRAATQQDLAKMKGVNSSNIGRNAKNSNAETFNYRNKKYIVFDDVAYFDDIQWSDDLEWINYDEAIQTESVKTSQKSTSSRVSKSDTLQMIEAELANEKAQNEDYYKAVKQLQKDKRQLIEEKNALSVFQGKYNEAVKLVEVLKERAQSVDGKLNGKTNDIVDLNSSLSATKVQLANAEKDLMKLKKELAEAKTQFRMVSKELKTTEAEAENVRFELFKQLQSSKEEAKQLKADLKVITDKNLEQTVTDLKTANIELKIEIADFKLGETKEVNPIARLVRSTEFNMWFIAFVMASTAIGAATKLLLQDFPTSPVLIVTKAIALILVAISLGFGLVWFSNNKTGTKWKDNLAMAVLWLCEFSCISVLVGANTGIEMIDYQIRNIVFALFLPTMTFLLAHAIKDNKLKIDLNTQISLLKEVLAAQVDIKINIPEVTLSLKERILKYEEVRKANEKAKKFKWFGFLNK